TDRNAETAAGATTPDISEPSMVESATPEPSSRFLAGLNPEQQAAVLASAARLIIVAGPGTGKTRTLTYRIARLIDEQGAAPDAILAITFTNKAAEEMASRLKDLLGADAAERVVIKTFHAFGAMLLREADTHLDLPPNFAISSEQERQSLLKRHYPDVSSRDLNRQLEAISAAKGQLLTPDDVDESLVDIYRTYQQT
ncbi:MAG: UvrD-helicase domain-containing protein, partial [Anaerolineae bacterium]|nr:UvrD-helicase domain-containing protein [Anaerolineae bacterium]